ncbi:MAG: NAD(P)H-dependent glycerol-3-phosphate dehydrogenase [Gammaproteobacteria bacterium]|nr:NAD(P)H-dependent glycerol-3-phosphate dehydrogenase [Gammaproteobacteria bacterium]
MTGIAVIGLGNFGTALARNWAVHGKAVRGWTVEAEVFASIKSVGVNEKYLPGIELPGLKATLDLGEAVQGADILALALPSHVVLSVVDQLLERLRDGQVLIDLAKGLAPNEELVSEAIAAKLAAAGRSNPLAVMTGPTIAPELASGVLTTALVASADEAVAQGLATELSTPTFIVAPAADPLGVELWGAFKNVIALACGLSDGLKLTGGLGGDNLKAALFTVGFNEGRRILAALGAQPETAFSAAGLGDLFVTATSPHGRNRRTGELLGCGQALDEALGSTVMVSEGVRATRMFAARTAAAGISAPFVAQLAELLDGKTDAEDCVRRMLSA